MAVTVGPLPALAAPHPLGAEDVEAFRRDGHVALRGLASPEEAAAYRPVIDGLVRTVAAGGDTQGRVDDYSSLFTQVTNVWRLSDAARRMVFAPRFAAVAARLLGVDGVRLYHDQALFKPAGGRATPWHQDQPYWPLDTDRTVTLWMPLVDVPLDMGPMMFASGSHRLEGLGEAVISADTDARLARLVAERGLRVWSEPLAAGDATFHLGRTLHAAHANASARTREVLTVIYYADGARVSLLDTPNRMADRDAFLPGLRPGDLAASPLNPVLFP